MAQQVVNACSSCSFMTVFENVLEGTGERMFQAMSSPISVVLSSFMVVMLLFHVQIRQFAKIMNSELDQAYFMQEIYANSGRLAAVALSIGTYTLWHDWVVGFLNLIILSIAKIVISALNPEILQSAKLLKTIQSSGGVSGTVANLWSQPDTVTASEFSDLMKHVYVASYAPLDTLNRALKVTDMSFLDSVFNGPAMWRINMSIWFLNFYASVSNTLWACRESLKKPIYEKY